MSHDKSLRLLNEIESVLASRESTSSKGNSANHINHSSSDLQQSTILLLPPNKSVKGTQTMFENVHLSQSSMTSVQPNVCNKSVQVMMYNLFEIFRIKEVNIISF